MMPRRTILHLINTGGPGGAETVCLELVRRLDPARWQSVVALPGGGWVHEQLQLMGVEAVPARSRVPFDLADVPTLVREIRKRPVHLIQSHYFGPSVLAGVLGRALRVPVVATVHGQSDLLPNERLRALKFWLLNHSITRAVFVSEPLRQAFLDSTALSAQRTTVIPNGIDPLLFTPGRDESVRAELGVASDDFVVGAVGNLRPAKGYDVLLRAAALLKARAPGYRFVLVGQASGETSRPVYEELMQLRAKLGLESDVVFTDFRMDVPRLLRAFDVYVISSRTEGFSISTVQAMACGLPVVATRCGGPEQILDAGRTGVLVDVDSPEQLAGALERLRHDPGARERLGTAARAVALERYTVEAQARAYERVYEQCLAARPTRQRPRRETR